MMKPDGTWVCPICSQDKRPGTVRVDVSGPTCWHGDNGCSTWYGGRLLHLSKEEVEVLKACRGQNFTFLQFMDSKLSGPAARHLSHLGFMKSGIERDWTMLTAEGENLCRHLWGMPQ